MARNTFIGEQGWGIEIDDVGGAFERFLRTASKEAKKRLEVPVLLTAGHLQDRMESLAPEGPDAPHIKNTVTYKQRGLRAEVGYLAEDFGAEQAAEGSKATIAEVALYNEYRPNAQPFMLPAAQAESRDFVRRIREALVSMERALQWRGL